MKKKIVSIVILLIILINVTLPVLAAENEIEMTNKEEISIAYVNRDGKNYVYSKSNWTNYIKINRYCFETNESIAIFESNKNFDVSRVIGYYVQDKMIYVSFYETNASTKVRVIGFDTQTEKISYDKEFPITQDKEVSQFIIDTKQIFYFVYNGTNGSSYTIASFTKEGKAIDNITTINSLGEYGQIELITTNPDSTTLFFKMNMNDGSRSWWDDYVIKINNGKFENKEAYCIRKMGGMNLKFLDSDGKYAYDQYGEILELNYNDNTKPSGVSFRVRKAISDNGSYIRTNGLSSSDDKYIYLGSANGKLYLVNWKTFNIERSISIGEDKAICGVHKSGDNIIVELKNNNQYISKYYYKTINLSELNSARKNVKITTHTSMNHTQDQIKQKYKDSTIVNKTSDLYEVKPVTTAPYEAGLLKAQVKTDTLNQINYFRWLSGMDNVKIYEPYMEYAQKGAVVLEANNILTHFPTKPSGMNDEFYNQGYKATSGNLLSSNFPRSSGNISHNSLMAYSIKGYVDDTNNVEPNVGHRLSILDPKATDTAFGFAGAYGVVDMLSSSTNKDIKDSFYSWPAPGNFPVESMDADAKWSIQLTNPNYYIDGVIDIVLKANGKTYSSKNNNFELYYDSSYNSYYFDIPTELKRYLTDGTNNLINGKKVEVEVLNIADDSGNTYTISYPINFFTVQDSKLGDVNADGKIDSRDAVIILKYVAHNVTLTSTQMLAADTSKDGKVDSRDAVQILKYVAHNITEF